MSSSVARRAARPRLAITAMQSGPAPSMRYTADRFFSDFSTKSWRGSSPPPPSRRQASTAGWRAISASETGTTESRAIRGHPGSDRPIGARGQNSPVLHLKPDIGLAEGADPVRDDKGCAPMHEALDCIDDCGLRRQVDRTGGLVEQQEGGIFEES